MKKKLSEIAVSLVSNGKGIFAADASPKTLAKRAQEMGMALETLEERLECRKMTLTIPGLGQYIGGVILHEESLGLTSYLDQQKILTGVKVDQGVVEMQSGSVEKITQGLADLPHRLTMYQQQGAKFTKWRAVIIIGPNTPTQENITANAKDLAEYAFLSQQAGLVPVVEPEVLIEGDHSIEKCLEVTKQVGEKVFTALASRGVDLSAMLYKPNMVVAGKDCSQSAGLEQVAKLTVQAMKSIAPTNLPGIVFLSGGQEAVLATLRLNEIAKLGVGVPWRWSFSFERALEKPAMQIWAGKGENISQAQVVLLHRAKCNSLASLGQYTMETENEV